MVWEIVLFPVKLEMLWRGGSQQKGFKDILLFWSEAMVLVSVACTDTVPHAAASMWTRPLGLDLHTTVGVSVSKACFLKWT